MALDTWPAGLPPLVGLAGSLGTPQLFEPAEETQMDDGPGRARRRTLFRETPRTIVLVLTRAQFVAFEEFARITLNNAAKRFTAPVRLRTGSLGTRVCRIRGAIAEADLGPNSRVSFTLVIFDW